MRLAAAGATGVIGRCLAPPLSEAGHEVTGLSRSQRYPPWCAGFRAEPHSIPIAA